MVSCFRRVYSWQVVIVFFVFSCVCCNSPAQNLSNAENTIGAAASTAKNIRAIFQDSKGNIWLGSDRGGVYKYDGRKLVLFTVKDGMCDNQVRSIQEDEKGNIWLGTGNGICWYNGKEFNILDEQAAIVQEGNWDKRPGDLWFAAGRFKGVYRLSHGKLYNYRFPEAISKGPSPTNAYDEFDVYCIRQDKDGNVWFGSQENGVCRYDGKNFTWFKDKGLAGAAVRAIYQDKAGDMWFGNNGYGLFRYNGKTLTNVTDEKGLDNPGFIKKFEGREGTLARVWDIAEDNAGNLWIATIDAGIWCYDGKTMKNYTPKEGLTDIGVSAVYRDVQGILWTGTAGAVCNMKGNFFKEVIFK